MFSRLVQLKPSEESFIRIVLERLPRLDVMILCEGLTETELLKRLLAKLDVKPRVTIGVTDCGGIDLVPRLTVATMLLLKLARKLKLIAIVCDTEDLSPEDRIQSFVDSLKSREINVRLEGSTGRNVFVARAHVYSRELPLLIAINGIFDFPFQRHTIEDHVIKLIMLERKVPEDKIDSIIDIIRNSKNAKEALQRMFEHIFGRFGEIDINAMLKIVEEADVVNIREAFPHICSLLELLRDYGYVTFT